MSNTATTVPMRELQIGDWLADGSVYVADKCNGDDGLWIEWSDGESGYISNPDKRVAIVWP